MMGPRYGVSCSNYTVSSRLSYCSANVNVTQDVERQRTSSDFVHCSLGSNWWAIEHYDLALVPSNTLHTDFRILPAI